MKMMFGLLVWSWDAFFTDPPDLAPATASASFISVTMMEKALC